MIVKASPQEIQKAGELLRAGRLVAFPTETVYGLGADAFNPDAIRRIYAAKGRPSTNPLIVHVEDYALIDRVAAIEANSDLRNRLEKIRPLWPGPLSVVLPRAKQITDEVTAGLNTVAVRIPAHPVAQALLRAAGIPVAAPSANVSQYVSATSAEHVLDCFGNSIDLILDGGAVPIGIESTVVSLVTPIPTILRQGAIPEERLRELFGAVNVQTVGAREKSSPSPGMDEKHYSPRTPMTFYTNSLDAAVMTRSAALAFSGSALARRDDEFATLSILNPSGSLEEAAQRLYSELRRLDKLNLELIVVDSCPEEGLGKAIMDRLRRAVSIKQ